jgi:hypothetical protein
MRKKTFPPLLKAALDKNAAEIPAINISTTASKVKCYYPSPKEIRADGFWTKKSPSILYGIRNQLPPFKIREVVFHQGSVY